jgi:hypothetical protein
VYRIKKTGGKPRPNERAVEPKKEGSANFTLLVVNMLS